jgi:hypothetical protein
LIIILFGEEVKGFPDDDDEDRHSREGLDGPPDGSLDALFKDAG